MDAVPDDVLHKLLRRAGRGTRRVCRRWRTAYGPPSGLYLSYSGIQAHTDALKSLSSTHASLARTHTLVLLPNDTAASQLLTGTLPSLDDPEFLLNVQATIQGLCLLLHICPTLRLRALHLPCSAQPIWCQAAFAPLAGLTSLNLALLNNAEAASLARTFTALRALTFSIATVTLAGQLRSAPLAGILSELAGHLPQLQRLSFLGSFRHGSSTACFSHAASSILQPLATMPALTHLAIAGTTLRDWDHSSVFLLATAWPRLAALSLNLDPACSHTPATAAAAPHDPPAEPGDVIAALAQRTALTALALGIPKAPSAADALLPCHQLASLSHLASLTLTHLARRQNEDPGLCSPLGCVLSAVVAAVPQPPPLTSVTFDSQQQGGPPLDRQQLLTCALLSATLTHFQFRGPIPPPHELEPLRHLTALRSLHLEAVAEARARPRAASRHPPLGSAALQAMAGGLCHLTSLTLWNTPWTAEELEAVVAAVAAQAPLQHLQASTWPTQPAYRVLLPLPAGASPASSTLARLRLRVPLGGIRPALDGLLGLTALRHLTLELDDRERLPGDVPRLYHLPPGLRVLVLDLSRWRSVAESKVLPTDRRLLRAAAALQDCAVRCIGQLYSVVEGGWRLAEYDDCDGYLDGAGPEYERFWEEECGI